MSRKPVKSRPRTKLRKFIIADPEVLAFAAKIMPVGDGQEPVGAFAWYDDQDRPRRLKVSYPNGCTATIGIGPDGRVRARSATVKLATA